MNEARSITNHPDWRWRGDYEPEPVDIDATKAAAEFRDGTGAGWRKLLLRDLMRKNTPPEEAG